MKYLIVPDVHGRDFWVKPVQEALNNDNIKIIFLGDYLDPYPDEFEKHVDYKELAFEQFKYILKLKNDYPNKITLLLGNHDASYAISTKICDCRRDYQRFSSIRELFHLNKDKFSLLTEVKQNDKRFIISHAGLSLEWLKQANMQGFTKENIVDYLNNKYELMVNSDNPEENEFAYDLGMCSYYRGGYNKVSSIVWADICEFVFGNLEYIDYQIFGHTRAYSKPIVCEKFAMLDCSKVFYLNEDGTITYENGENAQNFTFDELSQK